MQQRADFPYYAGEPVAISSGGWMLVLAAVVVAFLQLVFWPWQTTPLNFGAAILFTGLPLVALMAVSGWHSPALFGPVTWRVVALGLGFGVLTLVISAGAGIAVSQLYGANPNAATEGIDSMSMGELLLFLARTFIQLIGEEVVSILPLLAVLWFSVSKLGLSRRNGIIAGVVVSTLWFSAMHLPTYGWNFVQCLGIIGTARVVMTVAYLVTRNIWVSTIAHIFNDWTLFLLSFGLGHMPIGMDG
ncbi:MAG: CPBP family intramembrane metalloprotease [Hyphomicrobiales bacterium]|nr:MAG: CPBP family intramembrane metalloprotease [Hyphomicrobiales bacterium]